MSQSKLAFGVSGFQIEDSVKTQDDAEATGVMCPWEVYLDLLARDSG